VAATLSCGSTDETTDAATHTDASASDAMVAEDAQLADGAPTDAGVAGRCFPDQGFDAGVSFDAGCQNGTPTDPMGNCPPGCRVFA
jgi:hypothetical protein